MDKKKKIIILNYFGKNTVQLEEFLKAIAKNIK